MEGYGLEATVAGEGAGFKGGLLVTDESIEGK
jgi:hypothetical protein